MKRNLLEIILGFIGFYLIYYIVYVFNDIWDFEEDKKKKIYFGKVLVRGFVSKEEYLAIGTINLSLGLILSNLNCIKVIGIILLIGIIRTLTKNFYIRVITLFILQVLNILVFYFIFFEDNIDYFFKTYNILVTLSISLIYTTLYVIYRKSESKREFLKLIKGYFLALIIFLLIIPKISILKKILIILSVLFIALALKSSKNYLKVIFFYTISIVFLILSVFL